MTSAPRPDSRPDPDPDTTTGLDAGGGVAPGDTPPGESAIAGVSAPQQAPRRGPAPLIALGAVGLVIAGAVLFAVGRAVGLFG